MNSEWEWSGAEAEAGVATRVDCHPAGCHSVSQLMQSPGLVYNFIKFGTEADLITGQLLDALTPFA